MTQSAYDLLLENEKLRALLLEQWLDNHAEYCGKDVTGGWPPHEGDCYRHAPIELERILRDRVLGNGH